MALMPIVLAMLSNRGSGTASPTQANYAPAASMGFAESRPVELLGVPAHRLKGEDVDRLAERAGRVDHGTIK